MLRRILDVLANQFVVNIASVADTSLRSFPDRARRTLESWPSKPLHEAPEICQHDLPGLSLPCPGPE